MKPINSTSNGVERWEKITKIFESASGLTGRKRDMFLQKSCGDDAEMRKEVEKLLGSFEDSDSFMQNPAVAEAVSLFEDKKTLIGKNTMGKVYTGSFTAGMILASRYRIIGLLGKGGMGEVYKAEDIKLSQTVALKFLPDSLQKDAAALERFHAEVRNARQVSHVNVCRVFDIGEIEGRHFLSMEFIDGDDLSSLLRRVGRLSSERAVEIARQLCVGLSAIHSAGILHRDFKPANVIIDSKGSVRITDFGIAGVEAEIAKDNLRVGTPAYMSPEQIAGKDVSQKSDIYALGLVLYEIFTGKQAFQADSIPELIRKQTFETPSNPSEFVKGFDPLIESVIAQCIEKEPNNRPASALHVAMALPGGNPLQIALDAGQTPTPEMLAASPKKGALSPKVALACFAFFIAALLSIVYLQGIYNPFNLSPLNKSSAVLDENCRRMLKNFGFQEKPADSASYFTADPGVLSYLGENETTANTAERLRDGQPWFAIYAYQQSPIPFNGYGGLVSWNSPPFTFPGMVRLATDSTGRLINFSAVPPPTYHGDGVKTDWKKFFDEAGLDINKFEKAPPQWTPPVAFTEQISWTGTMTHWADLPLRVEAASFEGKPVYFEVKAPWEKPQSVETIEQSKSATILLLTLTCLLFTGIILLVRRNIKQGKADLRGTAKIMLFFLIVGLPISFVRTHHVFAAEEFQFLFQILMLNLTFSVFFGLCYTALEPFVRRRWSEYLISWSRLLNGDFRDPMVGRDILIGGVAGCVYILIIYLSKFIKEFGLGEKRILDVTWAWGSFDSLPESIAVLLNTLLDSVANGGLAFLAVFLIIFFFVRRKTVALILICLIHTVLFKPENESHPIIYAGVAVGMVMMTVVFNRYGLVALISLAFFMRLENIFPLTFNPASILFPQTVITLIILCGVMAYAAYISIGNAKMLGEKVFSDF